MVGAGRLNSLNQPSSPAGLRRTSIRNCSDSIAKECLTPRGRKTIVPGVALMVRSPTALQHVKRFLFPMMDVRRRNIAFSGYRLDQRELPLGVFGCSQEGHQRTAVPDGPIQRLPSSTKRGGFFDFGVYFDLGCHDRLLSILRVLFAAAQQTI